MRFVHSFNSTPIFFRHFPIPEFYRLISQIIFAANSMAWVKHHGHKIVLHTDSFGKMFFEHLPYDEIYTTLDEIPINEVHPIFWACGKMWAMEKEPLNSIHIDTDVILYKPLIYDIIENKLKNSDIIVQNFEKDIKDNYINHCLYIFENDNEFNLLDVNNIQAFNTGVMGFNNQQLKNDFIHKYKQCVFFLTNKYGDLFSEKIELIPDLLTEQMGLCQITLQGNYKPSYLLDSLGIEIKDYPLIGYNHILTNMKVFRTKEFLEQLKHLNSTIYKETMDVIQILMDKYNIDTLYLPIDKEQQIVTFKNNNHIIVPEEFKRNQKWIKFD